MGAALDNNELGFWFLMQLFKGHCTRDHHLHFRAIANERPTIDQKTGRLIHKTRAVATMTVSLVGFKEAWFKPGGVYEQLKSLNENPELPANIYYALALRTRKEGVQDKAACIGMTSAYLDQDVTQHWSLIERRDQLAYWASLGFKPSVTIGSGHGVQPIWVWDTRVDADIGEPILKNMVMLSGCQGKGNCWDVTRILRLPGFRNVKHWYDGDTPDCVILDPDPDWIRESMESNILVPRYSWEKFKTFPVSGKENIAEFHQTAVVLGGPGAKEIAELADSVEKHRKDRRIRTLAEAIQNVPTPSLMDLDKKRIAEDFAPIHNLVPFNLEDLNVPRKDRKWFALYCSKGFAGLAHKDIDYIMQRTGFKREVSASELDAKVMYQLIRCRFTYAAIEEFWRRPTLGLHREDKASRSPDYLRRTYDKMWEFHLAAEEQREKDEATARASINSVFKDPEGNLCIVRSDKRNDIVITGDMDVTERYLDMDEPVEEKHEYFRATVTDASKNTSVWTMQRTLFGSLKEFKRRSKGDLFVLAKHDSDLQALLCYLLTRNKDKIKTGRFHSVLKYIPEEHRMAFPYYLVGKDSIEFLNNAELVGLVNRQMTLTRSWLSKDPGRDAAFKEFSRIWPSMLRMHCPRFVLSCVSSLVMAAMRQIFQKNKHVSINVPTLNFRGASCSGKTETMYEMFRITGSTNPREQRLGASSSMFGISKMIEVCQIVPLVVDEFKEEDEGRGLNTHMNNLRKLVRTLFSGETIAKGRTDLSVNCQMLQALMWIGGEGILERAGHLAELTRIATIDTDNWDTRASHQQFLNVRNSHLEFIGPYFYQYLLNRDVDEEYARFTELEVKYTKVLEDHFGRLSSRAATNIACMIYGVRLWDRFLQHVNKNLQRIEDFVDLDDEVTSYMINHANRSGDILKINYRGRAIIRERDEAWTFLDALGRMVQNKDKAITDLEDRYTPCYAVSPDKQHLYIYLQLAYDAYKQYCLRLQYKTFELSTIEARIFAAHRRREEWVLSPETPYSSSGRVPQPAVKLDLPLLQNLGYWPKDAEPTLGMGGLNDLMK